MDSCDRAKIDILQFHLFKEVNMPESHGLQHCLTVLDHMDKAIQAGWHE